MIVCAIETSGKIGGVALLEGAEGERVLAEERYDEGLRHGKAILPSVEACLVRAGLPKGRVDLYVVGTGPGSYTGLRVGIVTGRMLAWALGKALAGASSFDAVALGVPAEALVGAGSLVVAEDARRDRLYVGRYDPLTRARRGAFEVKAVSEALDAALHEAAGARVVVAGHALERHPSLAERATVIAGEPRARDLGRIGLAAHRAAPAATLHAVEPIYLTAGVAALDG